MPVSSRLLILRSNKPAVQLNMQFDGYFRGQGNILCHQIVHLASLCSNIALQSKVDALDVEDLPSTSKQYFSAEYLSDLVEGHANFMNDPKVPWSVDFEYTIDFGKGLMFANSLKHQMRFVVTFDSIRDGFRVGELEKYLVTADVPTISR